MSLRFYGKGISDVGRRRDGNEDAFTVDNDLQLYVVADGVGGRPAGELASQQAIEQIVDFMRQRREVIEVFAKNPTPTRGDDVRRVLEAAVQNACYMLFGLGELEPTQRGMSTTVSALLLVGETGFVAQVGDSRVYRVRQGKAEQLTEDHTLVADEIKSGMITPAEAKKHKQKNVITRAVGQLDYVEVDMRLLDAADHDLYVLCSDGLHRYVEPRELADIASRGAAERAPHRFVQLANQRGGKDNITVIVVEAIAA